MSLGGRDGAAVVGCVAGGPQSLAAQKSLRSILQKNRRASSITPFTPYNSGGVALPLNHFSSLLLASRRIPFRQLSLDNSKISVPTTMKLLLLLTTVAFLPWGVRAASGRLCDRCRCVKLTNGHLLDCQGATLEEPLKGTMVAGFTHLNLKNTVFTATCDAFKFANVHLVDMRGSIWGDMCHQLKFCPPLRGKVQTYRTTYIRKVQTYRTTYILRTNTLSFVRLSFRRMPAKIQSTPRVLRRRE